MREGKQIPFKNEHHIFMTLPNIDEHGTPTTKMPYCPRCSEDELSWIGDHAFCNNCYLDIYPIYSANCPYMYIEDIHKPGAKIKCKFEQMSSK